MGGDEWEIAVRAAHDEHPGKSGVDLAVGFHVPVRWYQ